MRRAHASCLWTVVVMLWWTDLVPAQQRALPDQPAYSARPTSSAASGGSGQPLATRQTTFTIPFSVSPAKTRPIEVQLYVSTDDGQNWHLHSRKAPTEREFLFKASQDGSYWFASWTVYPQMAGQTPRTFQPELRVLVDTALPQIQLEASANAASQLQAEWSVSDPNLKADTFKLEYRAGASQPWQPVRYEPEASATADRVAGSAKWWADKGATAIDVRAEVRDQAGNLAVASRHVVLPPETTYTLPPPSKPPATPPSPAPATNPQQEPITTPPRDPYAPAATTPVTAPNPNDKLAGGGIAVGAGNQKQDASGYHAVYAQPKPPVAQREALSPAVGGPREEVTSLPAGERPQMTNSRRFQLTYDVQSVTRADLSKVELWMTSDGGQTWRQSSTDEDRQSPIDVEVNQEGVYGFRLVLVSASGLSSPTPKPGDLADMWIAVDTTPPQAQLTSARYGEGNRAGQLQIVWEAHDQFLSDSPVTLQFSQSAGGPWNTIAAGVPNSGQYYWPIDAAAPKQVFLRLEVRDLAGNVVTDQTDQPVNLEALIPKGFLRSLVPAKS